MGQFAELGRNGWVGDLVAGPIRIIARATHETEHALDYHKMVKWACEPSLAKGPADTIRKSTVREILGLSIKSA